MSGFIAGIVGSIFPSAAFAVTAAGVDGVPKTCEASKKCSGEIKITLEADQYYDMWSPNYEKYLGQVSSGNVSKKIRGYVTLENGVEVNLTELILKADCDPDGWFDGLEDVTWEVMTAYILGLGFEAKDGKLSGRPWYVDASGKRQEIDMAKFNEVVTMVKQSSAYPKGDRTVIPDRPYDMWSRGGYRSNKNEYRWYSLAKGLGNVPPLSFYVPCEVMDKNFVENNLLQRKPEPPKPKPEPPKPKPEEKPKYTGKPKNTGKPKPQPQQQQSKPAGKKTPPPVNFVPR